MDKLKKTDKKAKNRKPSKSALAKQAAARGFFDRSCLFLFLVLMAAFLICRGRPYELQASVCHGHALWFLLLTAYPFLGLLGLINVIFGTADSALMHYFTHGNPVLGLAAADAVYLLAVWLLLRWRGVRWFGAGGLRAAGNLVLILAFWGVFQLFLTGLMFLWDSGGLAPFHPEEPASRTEEVAAPGNGDAKP